MLPMTNENGPFGTEGAERYDNDAIRMGLRYKTAHAIQNALVADALRCANIPLPTVVDLGCGTGTDGIAILSRVPHSGYIGVDISGPMLKCAQAKFGRQTFRNSWNVLLHCDFR